MNIDFLTVWIKSAVVDEYKNGNKQVIIATKGNEQLLLICHRVEYSHGLHPHVNLIWINNGTSELLYQDIVDATYGQVIHSTGNLEGEHIPSENLETIWRVLLERRASPEETLRRF